MNNDVIGLGADAIEANSVIRERISRAKTVIKNELDDYGRRAKALRDISKAKAVAERRNDRKMNDKTEACLRAVSHEYDDCYRAASECNDRLCRYISVLEKDWNKLIMQVGILDSKSAPREQNEFHKFKKFLDAEKGKCDDLLMSEGIELGNYTKATVVESVIPDPVYKAPASPLPDPVPAAAPVAEVVEPVAEDTEEKHEASAEPKHVTVAPVTIDISDYVDRAVRQTVDKMAALVDRRIEEYFKNYKPVVSDELVEKIVEQIVAKMPAVDTPAAVSVSEAVVNVAEAAPKEELVIPVPTEESPKVEAAPESAEAPKTEEAPKVEAAPESAEAPKTEEAPEVEAAPESAEAPKTEEAPEVEAAPESAEAPKIEEAPEVEAAPVTEEPKISLDAECAAIAAKIADDEKFLIDKLIGIIGQIKGLNANMADVAAAYSEIESRFREIAEMQRVTNDMQRHTLREQQGIQVSQRVINKDQLAVAEEQMVLSDAQKKSTEEQKRVSAAQDMVAENQKAVAETQVSIEEAMKQVLGDQKRIIAAQQQIIGETEKQIEMNTKIAEHQAQIGEEQKSMLSSQKAVLKDQKSAADRQRETADAQRGLMEEVKQIMKARPKVK